MEKTDTEGLTSKDRALSRFLEYKAKVSGTRPQDIPETDEFPEADISDILRNYQGTSYGYQD